MSEKQEIINDLNNTIVKLDARIQYLEESLDSIRIFVDAYHALNRNGESSICGTMLNAIEHILNETEA